jgi:hypothetical protein
VTKKKRQIWQTNAARTTCLVCLIDYKLAIKLLNIQSGTRFAAIPKHFIGTSMFGDCLECKRLSENLAEATKAYFAVLKKRQLAQNAGNDSPQLDALKTAAVERRAKARLDLRQHQATHPTTNAAGSADDSMAKG